MRGIVRAMLAMIVMFGIITNVIATQENFDGSIYLKAETSKVKVGQEFTVTVYVETSKKVGALQFSILYDPNIVEIKKVELAENNKHVMFQDKEEGGKVVCGVITLTGVNPGKLIDIKAVAVKKGKAEFSIELQEVADINVKPLNFDVGKPLVIYIKAEPSPSPSTSTSLHTTSSTSFTSTTTTTTKASQTQRTSSTSSQTQTKHQTTTTPTSSVAEQTVTSKTLTKSTTSRKISTSTYKASTESSVSKVSKEGTTTAKAKTVTTTSRAHSLPSTEKFAKVFISSFPSGAEVYLNGSYLGNTPLMIEVGEGEYTIKAVYGNMTKEKRIVARGGEEYSLSFVFKNQTESSKHSSRGICGVGSLIILSLIAGVGRFRRTHCV